MISSPDQHGEVLLEAWAPGPVETAGTVHPWPGAAFAALLDLPSAPGVGDPLPPLWHWFHLLDHPRQSELGDDGHPAAGHFFPPMPHRRRMIAGGRLRVTRPIRIGDDVVRRSSLAAVQEKTGRSGAMVFVTVRSEFRLAGSDDVLLTEEQDVVYRSQPPGQARTEPPAGTADDDPPADWCFATATDPALLFRFSALTYNTHRIHYDQPYVTGVEGYPGLVVHGPLLALLLLEIPRRHRPDATVTAFDYRLTRPVFAGATVVTSGRAAGDGVVLSAAATGAPPSITGSATLTPGAFGTESS